MPNTAKKLPTMQMLEQVLGQTLARKTATSFDSVSTTESDPNVSNKLKLTGEGFTDATSTEFGKQITRDLVNQGPNSGPLPDKPVSNLPEDQSSFNDIPGNPLYDVFSTPEEPTARREDDDPNVSDKLKLRKDAQAVLDAIHKQASVGNELIEYVSRWITASPVQSAGQKQAEATITGDQILSDVSKLASADDAEVAEGYIKTAFANMIDDALYAADAVAHDLNAESENYVRQQEQPAKFGGFTGLNDNQKRANDGLDVPEAAGAMSAMSDPAPQADLSDEEALALMDASLLENGIDVDALSLEDGVEGGGDDLGDIEPELIEFLAQLEEAGISPEEAIEAIEEIAAEEDQGIPVDAGVEADLEAAKTGHYKFASFIRRPSTKTAEQEQRSANIRYAVRDFLYGPGTRNFN